MAWQSSSSQSDSDDTPNYLIDPSLLTQYLAITNSQSTSPIPAHYPVVQPFPSHSSPSEIHPHVWTNPMSDPAGRNISSPMAGGEPTLWEHHRSSHGPHNSIAAISPEAWSAFSAPHDTPLQGGMSISANLSLVPFNDEVIHRQHMPSQTSQAPDLNQAPVFQCQWQPCHSSNSFSSPDDLIHHLKTEHISLGLRPPARPPIGSSTSYNLSASSGLLLQDGFNANMDLRLLNSNMVHQQGFTNQTSQMPNSRGAPVLQCRWLGCRSSTHFSRENDFMRHIKTIHIFPGAHPCPEDKCGKVFGRKDHLREHKKRRHGAA